MARWILKTEPSTYSFADLVKAGRATWDGVTNPVALRNIRSMQKGDELMIYHTGDEKAVVGFATVVSAPYPDPRDKSGKLVVVDIAPGKPLASPVTLAAIRGEPKLKEIALVRQPRLSVVSADEVQWKTLVRMGSIG